MVSTPFVNGQRLIVVENQLRTEEAWRSSTSHPSACSSWLEVLYAHGYEHKALW
jgi:hypothetical protein